MCDNQNLGKKNEVGDWRKKIKVIIHCFRGLLFLENLLFLFKSGWSRLLKSNYGWFRIMGNLLSAGN